MPVSISLMEAELAGKYGLKKKHKEKQKARKEMKKRIPRGKSKQFTWQTKGHKVHLGEYRGQKIFKRRIRQEQGRKSIETERKERKKKHAQEGREDG